MQNFLDKLTATIDAINSFLWGPYFLIALLCGTGAYFTARLHLVQIFKFRMGARKLFGNFSLHGQPGRRQHRVSDGRAGRDILDVVRSVFRHGDEFRRDLPGSNLPHQGRQRTYDRRARVLHQSRTQKPPCQAFSGIFCASHHLCFGFHGQYGAGKLHLRRL